MVRPQLHCMMLKVADMAPCIGKLWVPPGFLMANLFLGYMVVDGHLKDSCETSHLVLNIMGRRKSLKYPLQGGKEALAPTQFRNCGREGLPINLVPVFTTEHPRM